MEEKLIIKTEEGPFVIGCVIWEIALFIWLWMEGNKRVNAEGRLPNMTENIVVMLLIVVCCFQTEESIKISGKGLDYNADKDLFFQKMEEWGIELDPEVDEWVG